MQDHIQQLTGELLKTSHFFSLFVDVNQTDSFVLIFISLIKYPDKKYYNLYKREIQLFAQSY